MAEIPIPAKSKKASELLAIFSNNPKDPAVASWEGNQVVIEGDLILNDRHKKLPKGMIVEGSILGEKSAVEKYTNLTVYGSMELSGNKHVKSIDQSARILGTEPNQIADPTDPHRVPKPTAEDLRHIENAMKWGARRGPGVLHIEQIPHEMENLAPKCTGHVVFFGTCAKHKDANGVGDPYSQTKMKDHFDRMIDAVAARRQGTKAIPARSSQSISESIPVASGKVPGNAGHTFEIRTGL